MERYVIRAAKYAIYLCLLFFIIFAVMNIFNGSKVSVFSMISGARGFMFLGVVVIFALIYPFMGYTKRTLVFDASKREEEVVNVMSTCGFVRLDDSTANVLKFRARSASKRMAMHWEDLIVVETVDGLSTIRGARREVVRAAFRFGTFIS